MSDQKNHDDIIRQHKWSKEELRKQGFQPYQRKKQLVMARQLPELADTLVIKREDGEELIAKPGYMICYDPGDRVRHSLEAYDRWPVEPEIFKQTYRKWDEEDWQPTPPEKHLLKLGCTPYYKAVGVWAKQTEQDIYLQSLEHKSPIKVETGRYIAIGEEGEPYDMGDETFQQRYQSPRERRLNLLRRLLGFLKGDKD